MRGSSISKRPTDDGGRGCVRLKAGENKSARGIYIRNYVWKKARKCSCRVCRNILGCGRRPGVTFDAHQQCLEGVNSGVGDRGVFYFVVQPKLVLYWMYSIVYSICSLTPPCTGCDRLIISLTSPSVRRISDHACHSRRLLFLYPVVYATDNALCWVYLVIFSSLTRPFPRCI